MSEIVVVSGNPRPGSRTAALVAAVGSAIADRRGAAAPVTIEVGDLGPGLLTPGDPATADAVAALTGAKILVVATPTYKGSYTGVLKVLLDQLPARSLAGIRAVPVVTAGVPEQAAAALTLLRQLLGELGADVLDGLAVVEADLADSAAIAEKHAAAHDW
jgi:FMN reductase